MKKVMISIIIGVLLTITSTVYGEAGLQKIEAYLRPDLPITLDGKSVSLESPPVIYDGSTYLKLKDVASLTGLKVNWNDTTQTVELQSGKQGAVTVHEATGATETKFNGLRAIILNGETYFSPSDYNRTAPEKKLWGFDPSTRNTYQQKYDGTKTEINVDDPLYAQKYNGDTYINIKYYEAP